MKAKDLIENVAWGDRAAAEKLRELVRDDDEAWAEVLRELRSPRREPDDKEREAFWAELRRVAALIDSNPSMGKADLAELQERAWRFGSCERVQVLAVDGYRFRLLGKLEEAEIAIERAREMAAGCRLRRDRDDVNPCLLDVGRRHSLLLAAQDRREEALAEAESTIDGYRRLGGPGHDLHGQGLAQALVARGPIRSAMGDPAAASADFAEALSLVPPELEDLHDAILYDLAWALFETGAAGKKEADKLLTRLRRSFSQRPQSVQRAHFDWLDSMLGWEVRRVNRHRARKKLHETQEAFYSPLGMPDEFVAATGDLLLVYFPDRREMRRVLEKAKRMGEGFITDPEQWRRLCELEKLVSAGIWTPHDDLESAVRALRESVSGVRGIIPSLIRTTRAG
ncbi:MAG TPA: hypothetical protein VGG06_11585 [Thermoanaerobaculia bacterium]|jgi:tetratricopeptide (TPR) repeat protein